LIRLNLLNLRDRALVFQHQLSNDVLMFYLKLLNGHLLVHLKPFHGGQVVSLNLVQLALQLGDVGVDELRKA